MTRSSSPHWSGRCVLVTIGLAMKLHILRAQPEGYVTSQRRRRSAFTPQRRKRSAAVVCLRQDLQMQADEEARSRTDASEAKRADGTERLRKSEGTRSALLLQCRRKQSQLVPSHHDTAPVRTSLQQLLSYRAPTRISTITPMLKNTASNNNTYSLSH